MYCSVMCRRHVNEGIKSRVKYNLTESGPFLHSPGASLVLGANEGGPDTILYLTACKKPDPGFLV